MAEDLLTVTPEGLYCPAGGFHIDPWRPVPRALITHAHGDHARPGSVSYCTAEDGVALVKLRVGDGEVTGVGYGEEFAMGDVRVSLHPAGHLLGSAQVRIAHRGGTWVVSGDYKTTADPTCAAFEPVPCQVFVSESTFGLPIYRWPAPASIFADIDAWWRVNQDQGRTSVLSAYALGKAQRVLAGIDASIGPLLVHGMVQRFLPPYQAAGVQLPPTVGVEGTTAVRGRGLVLAPPSAANSPWLRRFGECSTAFASGWMQVRGNRRRRNLDRGFPLSDHADWNGLIGAIRATGAARVLVTHGQVPALVRWLRENGWQADALSTRFDGDMDGEEGLQEAGTAGGASGPLAAVGEEPAS
jgi:putative mRNA 3-end processing factor